jgi:hypothetical protein
LAGEHLAWFLDRLPGGEHWRALVSRISQGLYLDIETTGGGPGRDALTVLGVLEEGIFHQWVWPQDMTEVNAMIRRAPFVGSFAGRGFDVPFLRRSVAGFPEPRAHIDLLSLARKAGIRGGLKGVEAYYGLERDEDVRGLRGLHAVSLWERAQGGDASARDILLRYNRADVEMLPLIAGFLCRDLLAACCPEAEEDLESLDRAAVGDLLESRLVRVDGGESPVPWLLAQSQHLRSLLGQDAVVVAIAGGTWVKLQGRFDCTCGFLREQDALLLTRAACPDLVILGEDMWEAQERFQQAGLEVHSQTLEDARKMLPGTFENLRSQLRGLGVRDLASKPDAALPALGLALVGLLHLDPQVGVSVATVA